MISIKNLTKIYSSPERTGNIVRDFFARQYKYHMAVNDISFSIDGTELVGFIGPNGAGKTTTLKMLAGILYPTSGLINVLGFTPFDKKKEFLRSIAFVMGQKNQLLWDLPPTDSFDLNREIYEINEHDYRKHVGELVDLLDCHSFINQPVKTLSLGQRMRVELIGALIHRPKILFLDEPTIGLDVFAQGIIINFIKEYQEHYKSIIMLTSHYMKDIQQLAKRVVLIDHGRIIFDGALDALVHKYSQEKVAKITLRTNLKESELKKLPGHYEYIFPQLTIFAKKTTLAHELEKLLSQLDIADFTLEDEPIEEVIKKVFVNVKEK